MNDLSLPQRFVASGRGESLPLVEMLTQFVGDDSGEQSEFGSLP